jgi:uncharacterized repeat protein (TIGR03803 family)
VKYWGILGGAFLGALLASCGRSETATPVSLVPYGDLHGAQRLGNLKVLYDFKGGADGEFGTGGLIADASGNLFGTTANGGSQNSLCNGFGGCGTVYELMKSGKRYRERVLYRFQGAPDGNFPQYETLLADANGVLYGTTYIGGTGPGSQGLGAVFELTPSGRGYSEKIIYSFGSNDGGGGPLSGVISDARGNLYGTASGGPLYGNGEVYKLVPSGSSYKRKVLYAFQNNGNDGNQPWGALVRGRHGVLYGTTSAGGAYGFGTIFSLIPAQNKYTERVIYGFGTNANDGKYPLTGLSFDGRNTFYGTTSQGGATGNGTVFKLSSSRESTLYNFGAAPDGSSPESPLLLRRGELYGTTFYGGSAHLGTIYQLSLTGSEKILYSFDCGSTGVYPYAGVIADKLGHLFGATSGGCSTTRYLGAVFELH